MKLDVPDSPRILVSRTDALGDVILTTPVYRALKAAFPNSEITVLCREYTEPVLKHNPYVDRIITIVDESKSELESVVAEVEGAGFDIGIALYPSAFAASVLRGAKVPVRIGSARRFHSWKFTHRVNQSRKRNEKSEAQYNLDVLSALGIDSSDIIPEVILKDSDRSQARELLSDEVLSDGFVVLHPGSGGSAIDWPLQRFVELADELCVGGKRVVFTGNEAEGVVIQSALSLAAVKTESIILLAGRTSLLTLAGVLEAADVVVANSTGPLHLAAAVGTGTVGLFPKGEAMSSTRWAPPVENCVVLKPDSGGEELEIPVAVVYEAVVSSISSNVK